ncbi:MAG: hypothetical protein C3F17_07435 [Bradyrhizobiaceae bacterium]|nr:MAG: hypothetical protein C3F17_07435 [Bradyrhizobiaceae bacterium]
MMTLTLATAASRRLATGLRRLARTAYATLKSARERRALAQLLALDERMLHDIGLARGDVIDAMALPVGQDAGSFLEDRRRGARRPILIATRVATPSALPAPANEPEARRAA